MDVGAQAHAPQVEMSTGRLTVFTYINQLVRQEITAGLHFDNERRGAAVQVTTERREATAAA